MTKIAVEMEHVYKKFKKGELYNSLRDAIPAMTKNLFRKIIDRDLKPKEFWALEDVSFQVKKGESLGIIGHNGAGKSTILKHLSGILKPTSGTVRVDGRLSALIEVGAGFHGDLTGRENIFLNGTILGMKKKEIEQKFDDIVEFSGVKEFIDTPVKRYSSGMYLRLGFSVAAHLDPDILLIDEVLSVGDQLFQRKGMTKMKEILRGGATVIFISHNLKAISDFCQRTILLEKGMIVKEGPTPNVIEHYLDQDSMKYNDTTNKEVFISKFSIRDESGESLRFKSGQKVWAEIEVTARAKCENFSIIIVLTDNDNYDIMVASTERLGHDTLSIFPGEKIKCTFELSLHLAQGIFHFRSEIYRYDINKIYDRLFPAATIYMTSHLNIKGSANLYPKIIETEKVKDVIDDASTEQTKKGVASF